MPNPCANGTTVDMQVCWSKRNAAASAQLSNAYKSALDRYEAAGRSVTHLKSSQAYWSSAREATCAFEYSLYAGGTIAAQLFVECDDRSNRARSAELDVLKPTTHPALQPVSRVADVSLQRLLRLYDAQLNAKQRSQLAAAQRSWTAYKESWCAVAGGACRTVVTNQRTAELEAAWMGEPFWK
jgi:uncharacterized protein YecT (DUF1311 family)